MKLPITNFFVREQWFDENLVDIDNRYKPIPYNPLAYSYFTLDSPMSDSEGLHQYVHFHRHGESVKVTEAKVAEGDIDAWDKIARTERDVRILAFGKGPITPFQPEATRDRAATDSQSRDLQQD